MYLQLKSINKSFADTDKETIKDVSLDIKKRRVYLYCRSVRMRQIDFA